MSGCTDPTHIAYESPGLTHLGAPHPPPVTSSSEALRVALLAMSDPLRAETIAFLLDPDGIGGVITVVTDTHDPDAVLTVADLVCSAGSLMPRPMSLVITSVRPDDEADVDDIDRWWTLGAITDRHRIRLLDWFVVTTRGVHCPRELCDEPDGWDQSALS